MRSSFTVRGVKMELETMSMRDKKTALCIIKTEGSYKNSGLIRTRKDKTTGDIYFYMIYIKDGVHVISMFDNLTDGVHLASIVL